ncbi:MAG TPA: glycosyltransferase family 39 protein [Thermoanaerobaculia bacterium]
MSRREKLAFLALAALSLVLRGVALLRYRFDSDEQQHLHVAWGWTAGLVQYRDYFDNHTPLFHLLTAPLLALFGERHDILLWMRLPMLLLFAVVIYATYVLGRRMYDARAGAWAALLVSLFPPFFLKSLEYRTDNLWNTLWMVALLVLTAGALSKKQMFVAGLILGCALATSMKTILLLVTLGGAALVLRSRRFSLVLPFFLGFAIVPALLVTYFVAAGAWDRLVYCVFEFNKGVALTRSNVWIGRVLFPFGLAGVLWLAWRFRGEEKLRYFFAVACGIFIVTLGGFWILISPRDFLPLMPIGAIFLAARLQLRQLGVAIALVLVALFYYADRFENNTDWHTTMMQQALRLSRPGEPLMDIKGETIYRPRPTYFIYEAITRAQMMKGLIPDTAAEDVVRTRTYVAQADGPMLPPRTRAFLSANFLDMGRLRAAGQWLQDDGSFSIAIPGEYVIVSERGEVLSARVYGVGAHRVPPTGERLAVMWAPAFRRGHSPFHLRDREF